MHKFKIYPYAWLKCFNEHETAEVAKIKERIIGSVRELEEFTRQRRAKEGKAVLGVAALLRQPIMAEHTPPPRERRVYVLASEAAARIEYIEDMKEFGHLCAEIYKAERGASAPAARCHAACVTACG